MIYYDFYLLLMIRCWNPNIMFATGSRNLRIAQLRMHVVSIKLFKREALFCTCLKCRIFHSLNQEPWSHSPAQLSVHQLFRCGDLDNMYDMRETVSRRDGR